jgi:putative membrane-bound dehydrogenase-like protein
LYNRAVAVAIRPGAAARFATEVLAMRPLPFAVLALGASLFVPPAAFAADQPAGFFAVGVAQIDITPTYPIRLSGFGFRRTESEGVTQKIWAKALAVGEDDPAILLTVDNLGVSAALVQEVAQRLEKKGVHRDRVAFTATHTHTAPMLTKVCPTLFGVPIPPDHQEHIDRYTREFTDALEKVALAALADRQPAKLSWGVGTVGFATNRRTKGGPVDHDLPVLVVRDPKGKVRAVYVSYACHCVTLSNNKVSGDWAGFAQEAIQDDFPGAVALLSVGCGADSNPSSGVTGDKAELAQRQGTEVAAEVKRLLKGYLAPITGPVMTQAQTIELPLADLPTRADWQERAQRKDAIGYHAQVQLARLDKGEMLRTKIDYPVMTWSFGDALAMVFLPGEVVVDYSLRLKKELDARRLWVNAYANDAPCYIPSERVLKEGGYEGGGAMVYYDVPGPFQPGLEKKIVDAVQAQIGKRFAAAIDANKTGGTLPLSPQQSLAALRTKKGLAVDVVAAEPLVASPVAIDFGPDGRLWVAEMFDYPTGLDGRFKPGGRVRVLEDTDGDGIFDKATVFLDHIPFPTGLTVWRKGVLVCAAPDILYAEDTDGDGKADVVKKLYSGFGTDNYQARVNSLHYGLDGWVYGSCGLFGGKIKSHQTGQTLDLGDRDFRIQPDTGAIEPATGRTQQGRVRNDWDDWFGCDNSELCRHYPLADHYLRRNPHVAAAATAVHVPADPDWNRLYPARQVQLFKLSGPPNRVTSACGLGIYRDDLLGAEYRGDTFTCEPVNLVVTRLKLTQRDSTFSGHRADDERQSEFLASTDNWFRPVQVRTGPDGALWVVDMYRYVIEHPRWIPPEDLQQLDVRAGQALGRIYRVRPADQALRRMPRLDQFDTAGLVAALDSPNGTQRDLAGQMLLWRADPSAAPALQKLAMASERPEVRLQALCVLDGLGKLPPKLVRQALEDSQPGLRRHAVRLAEKFLADNPGLGDAVAKLTEDVDAQVRLQAAYSLGAWRDAKVGPALAALALKHADDPHLVAAVLSSVNKENLADVLAEVFAAPTPSASLVRPLLEVATALGEKQAVATVLARITTADPKGNFAAWQMTALAELFDALARRKQPLEKIADEATQKQVQLMQHQAFIAAAGEATAETDRIAAVRVLGVLPGQSGDVSKVLRPLLGPRYSAAVQSAALVALARLPEGTGELLAGWKGYTPVLKSQVLDLVLSRDAGLPELLTALEQQTVPPGQIDAARRQRLLTHKDAEVRRRAAQVFEGSTNADRQKVVKDYATVVALKGDAIHGKALFVKTCFVCHRLEGAGHEVGPDLAALANKSAAYLIQEILDPNRNVDSRYLEYVVQTKNGRTFNGLLAAETATSITLRGQEGKEQVLLRTDIEELSSSGKSLMPEGLEKDIGRQDMADLLAYLGGFASPPKQFPGNRPAPVRAVQGEYPLLATSAAIHGGEIAFEEPFKNVGMWHGKDDYACWTVEIDKAGEYDVWLDWACADPVAGNAYALEGGQAALRGKVKATGGWDRYRQEKLGTVTLPGGTQRLTFRPDGELRGALLDLRGISLVPPGQKPVLSRP